MHALSSKPQTPNMLPLCLQYAGNVVVYGPSSPCDGDWFGGLRASNAPAFLRALLHMPLGSVGGPADPLLARHWRGRMGLTKDDQVPCQLCCGCPVILPASRDIMACSDSCRVCASLFVKILFTMRL